MGFFAETGPLQVFVSNHCIPEDFEFESAHEPSYVTATGDLKIQVKSEVRLRIVGTKINGPSIVSFIVSASNFHVKKVIF